jgi:head-tail adaptor
MRAGKLTEHIFYQLIPTTKSATGADVEGTPVRFASVYAQITPSRGNRGEMDAANMLITQTRFDLKHRPLSGITEGMQVLWGSRILNVLSAPYVNQRMPYMTVVAEEQR